MRQVRFPAMGTQVQVVVEGGPPSVLAAAQQRILQLESRWSRFRPDSEVSRLNRDGWAAISPETAALINRATTGWARTGGRFDPTVHEAMVGLGYDRDFAAITSDGAAPRPRRTPGCQGIEVGGGLARLPDGVGFDPGGIGKGFAADLVATQLLADGADAALVNIGGDLRAVGDPAAGAWGVRVHEPRAGVDVTVAVASGAVATSTPLRRTWQRAGQELHHLVDPGSGSPISDPPALVSVVAGEAWWAEVCTKAAMLTPPALLPGLLDEAAAMVVDGAGAVRMHNGMEDYLR